MNCEYVTVQNIELVMKKSNIKFTFLFSFQEINSKKISEVLESNSLLANM